MVLPASAGLGTPPGGGAAAPAAPLTKEDELTVAFDGETSFVTTESYIAGGLVVLSVNGQNFAQGTNFSFVLNALEWNDIPFPLKSGDVILVSYNHS